MAGSASPVRVGSLTGGALYRCVVRAVNADGVGLASDGSTFVIVPGPPSKLYGLNVTEAGGPRLRVAFNAPVSDGTSAITEYEARCVSGTKSIVTGKNTVSPVVTAVVEPGLAYRCQVRATNAYGTGMWSAFSVATTVTGVGVVIKQRTRVIGAGGDGGGGAARAEVDRRTVCAHLTGPVAPVGGIAEPQRAPAVRAPAFDGASTQSACVE